MIEGSLFIGLASIVHHIEEARFWCFRDRTLTELFFSTVGNEYATLLTLQVAGADHLAVQVSSTSLQK